jgi:putative holliday junction resolvase
VSQPNCVKAEIGRVEAGVLRSGVRLAVDVGTTRIGIASSDPGGVLASPLTTLRRREGDLAEIARLATDREAIEIVVGLPTSLSGVPGRAAGQAREFAEALAIVAHVPVRLLDERFTTVIAHAALREAGRDSRQRRGVVDQAAAASLLQGALDAERAAGGPPGELVGESIGGGG